MAVLQNWASLSLHKGSIQQHLVVGVTIQLCKGNKPKNKNKNHKQLVETLITVLFHQNLWLEREKLLPKSPLSFPIVMKTLLHLRKLCSQFMKRLKIHTTSRTTITKTNSNSRIIIKLKITSKTMVRNITNRIKEWLQAKGRLLPLKIFLRQ